MSAYLNALMEEASRERLLEEVARLYEENRRLRAAPSSDEPRVVEPTVPAACTLAKYKSTGEARPEGTHTCECEAPSECQAHRVCRKTAKPFAQWLREKVAAHRWMFNTEDAKHAEAALAACSASTQVEQWVVASLERIADDYEAQAAKLAEKGDYSCQFPEAEAKAVRLALAALSSVARSDTVRQLQVMLAWEATDLSEGQAASKLGVDRLTLREMRDAAKAEGLKP